MLRSRCSGSLRSLPKIGARSACFSSSTINHAAQPNAPLELDPSMRALLRDVDMSLMRHKSGEQVWEDPALHIPPRELELYDIQGLADDTTGELEYEDVYVQSKDTRKSPAAEFGSQRIGAIVIPLELQNSINRLIAESDKPMLHVDAQRLFMEDADANPDDAQWSAAYDVKYRSRVQEARFQERDGMAFASVALPAHYSVIYAVLDHVKHRLGDEWKVGRVIDWGSATGSGLWAAIHCFQGNVSYMDRRASRSAVFSYIGIEGRRGMKSISKRLVENVDIGSLNVSWQNSFHDSNKVDHADAGDLLALSAFHLSSLPTSHARKALVKEMWESGAHTMVLIDHNSPDGFHNIVEAREQLLKLGRKDMEDPAEESRSEETRGSYVIAPCPHDGACPLHLSGSERITCGFSQRLQRPKFVRRTKHSGKAYEDTGYSYVVVRRGQRPEKPDIKVGRVGQVGRRDLKREQRVALKKSAQHQLQVFDDAHRPTELGSILEKTSEVPEETQVEGGPLEPEIIETLRLESFSWPRLVFRPLKKNGHIILDCCTPESKIMRHIIPKSQGRQPYYDARKARWGDIFPHPPKNKPVERHIPIKAKREGDATPTKGAEIGKGDLDKGKKAKISYTEIEQELEDSKMKQRRRQKQTRREEDLEID